MKTIFTIAIAMALFSCTAPEITKETPNSYGDTLDCGIIVTTGEDNRGDYIKVRMPYHNQQQKDRYKVVNYMDYKLGKEICNFAGLTKQTE